MRQKNFPQLTFIICTYNRAELLRDCLASFLSEPINQFNYTILVVDNGSSDHTKQVIAEFQSHCKKIKGIYEANIGLSMARNAGYRAAESPWVGYIDDDAKIPEGFFNRVSKLLENPNFDCFGGTYYPWYRFGKVNWVRDAWFTKKQLRSTVGILGTNQYLSGGIFFIKRTFLADLGGFKEVLGMNGTSIGYGEEEELQNRIRAKAGRIGYDPHLYINHCVMPYKMKVRWLLKASQAKGRSWQLIDKPSLRVLLLKASKSLLGLLIKRLPISMVKLLSQSNYYRQNAWLDLFIPLFFYFGAVKARFNKESEIIQEGGL